MMTMRSPAALSVALGAVAVLAWLGCGSSVEETPGAEPEREERDTRGTPPPKPAFEAGFEEEEDAGSGGGTGTGGIDVEAGAGCPDPNDAPASVGKALPPTTDCNDTYLGLTGIVSSSVDEDLYTLSGTDETGCVLETQFNLETSKVELCVFVECKTSTADAVSGCDQGTLDVDPATSLEGCCRTTPGAIKPTFNCSGLSESATLYARVKGNPGAPVCQSYSVRYRF